MRFFLVLLVFLLMTCSHCISAQTILKQDGKYGLTDEGGEVILKPIYDSVIGSEDMPTFFIIRNNGKYAYTYKIEFDSLKWLDQKDRHWMVSEFKFDSLLLYSIGSSYYATGYAYSIIKYKKSGLWGLIYIQTSVSNGGGIFPSASFHAHAFGRQGISDARYEAIFGSEVDDFFTTYLNGKYGLWNVVTGEEYISEFDTIPVFKGGRGTGGWFGLRERYVRKNGAWGVIRMDGKTKTLGYVVPCQCNKVSKIWSEVYGCTGYGDTITFFDNTSHTEYTPTINGKPFVFSNDSVEVRIEPYNLYNQPMPPVAILVINRNSPPLESAGDYNEVYAINIPQKKITTFSESGKCYSFYIAVENGLIAKTELHPTGSKQLYEFYNMETGEFRFSFSLDTAFSYRLEDYDPKNCSKADEYRFVDFYYYDRNGRKKIIGYYDYREEKFTRRKPRYKSSR